MKTKILLLLIILAFAACNNKYVDEGIEDDKLGFIDADVTSEDTEFKTRAEYMGGRPGESPTFERSFENAPPMIPHTTSGFFPIKIDRNICLSCHMPDKAKEVNAIPLPETHMSNIRTQMTFVNGIYQSADETVVAKKLDNLNNAYFNCSQCHAPQTEVKIDITNLFTPEFRDEFGITNSDLIKRIDEGI
ncbi:MAG: nitrate reductase cytochrome c-type subunit [Melioribacteraceae bacterium]|nr:nitrate reductase cytochrome c-type subunit [Melioribacteraceae bacterium]